MNIKLSRRKDMKGILTNCPIFCHPCENFDFAVIFYKHTDMCHEKLFFSVRERAKFNKS